MSWLRGDRVKVSPDHHGTGLHGRLGTVLRATPTGYVEVELDSYYLAGIGIVAFWPEDLLPTKKRRRPRTKLRRLPQWPEKGQPPQTTTGTGSVGIGEPK